LLLKPVKTEILSLLTGSKKASGPVKAA